MPAMFGSDIARRKKLAFGTPDGTGALGVAPLETPGAGLRSAANTLERRSWLAEHSGAERARLDANDRADREFDAQMADRAAQRAFQNRQLELQQQQNNALMGMNQARLAFDVSNAGQTNALNRDKFGFDMADSMAGRALDKDRLAFDINKSKQDNETELQRSRLQQGENTRRSLIDNGMAPAQADQVVRTGDYSGLTTPLPMTTPRPPAPTRPFDPMAEMGKFRSASPKEEYGMFLEKAKASGDKRYSRLDALWGHVFDEDKVKKEYINYLNDYENKAKDYVSRRDAEYNQTYQPRQALQIEQASAPTFAPQQAIPEQQPYQPVSTPALALPGNAAVGRALDLAGRPPQADPQIADFLRQQGASDAEIQQAAANPAYMDFIRRKIAAGGM